MRGVSPAAVAGPARPTPVRVDAARPTRLRAVPDQAVALTPALRSPDRAAAAPSTRDRLRAALGAGEGARDERRAPTTPRPADAPSTRDRVAAGLREPPARESEAAVVDLTERRTRARTTEPGGASAAQPGPERLAPVIDFATGRIAGPVTGRVQTIAPKAENRSGEPRGPPAGGGSASGHTSAAHAAAPSPQRASAVSAFVRPGQRAPPSSATASPTAPIVSSTEPSGPSPEATATTSPALLSFAASAEAVAARTIAHQPGAPAASNAQAASAPDPIRDVDRQAATNHVEGLATREPGEFDAETFKQEVRRAVEALAPPATLEEADEFEESGRAGAAAQVAQGLVVQGQATSKSDLAAGAAAPLDREGLKSKPVGAMVNDRVGQAKPSIGAAGVLPGPRHDADVDFSGGPAGVDATMAARGVTDEQLIAANEPTFTAAHTARQDVIAHAQTAPLDYRTEEGALLPAAAEQLGAAETTALTGMYGTRVGALGAARSAKNRTKTLDENRRDDVNRRILTIHDETKTAVDGLLRGLDTDIPAMFTRGEADARDSFERFVDIKMQVYKSDRYGGLGGGVLWLKDKIVDLPDEVNEFYVDGREIYLFKLGKTIDAIAARISLTLTLATGLIRLGQLRVKHLVGTLPADLAELGATTAAQLDNRFDLLASDVGAAKDRMVDTVSRAYVEATGRLDTRIVELQEANKGLATRAVEFIEDVADTIADLGRLLARVLLKAVSVIGDILAHPIRFFGNLISAVGDGLSLFAERVGQHFENALVDLLFGQMGRAGIRLPTNLDYEGIFDLVCQVLGLTWPDIRARLINRLGLAAVLRMEQVADVFTLLADRGVGGLWEHAMQRLADLPDRIIGVLRTYIVEQVIKAGLAYVGSLLTPASAFIKACQGIYRLVSFVVEKAREIAEFVDGVLDSIAAIAAGDVRAAAERIDAALARVLKLAIGFLAKLAHLDAVSDKARSVIDALRTPVRNTVDAIIETAVRVYQATLGRRPAAAGVAAPGQPRAPPATRPAPAQEPADPQSLTASRPVVMDHTDHTLTVRIIKDQPEVVMSSRRGEYLKTVASAALYQEERGAQRPELIAKLGEIAAMLQDLIEDWHAASAEGKSGAEKKYGVDQWLGLLAEHLRDLGKTFRIQDLEHLGHASRYVEGNELAPPWNEDVRRWFYPRDYLSPTEKWRAGELARLRHKDDPRQFWDESTKQYEPTEDENSTKADENVTIDHKPRVVEHWNSEGNNTNQAARATYYNNVDAAHLQLVARKNNSADGALAKAMGHRYKPAVGKDFRGPLDEE